MYDKLTLKTELRTLISNFLQWTVPPRRVPHFQSTQYGVNMQPFKTLVLIFI